MKSLVRSSSALLKLSSNWKKERKRAIFLETSIEIKWKMILVTSIYLTAIFATILLRMQRYSKKLKLSQLLLSSDLLWIWVNNSGPAYFKLHNRDFSNLQYLRNFPLLERNNPFILQKHININLWLLKTWYRKHYQIVIMISLWFKSLFLQLVLVPFTL